MAHTYEHRSFMIFNVTELNKIDFNIPKQVSSKETFERESGKLQLAIPQTTTTQTNPARASSPQNESNHLISMKERDNSNVWFIGMMTNTFLKG